MADENKPAEPAEGGAAPAAPAKKESPPAVEHHAPAAEAPDWSAHFTELFKHIGELPEKTINALREAVPPPAKQEETAETVVGHEAPAEEGPPVPGKKGGHQKHGLQAKRSFADKWLSR